MLSTIAGLKFCSCLSVCLFVILHVCVFVCLQYKSKRNDPNVFKLGIVNELGLSYK